MSRPILKQPTFNWRADGKYEDLDIFEPKVRNMLQNVILGQTERVSVIKNWLGREGQ